MYSVLLDSELLFDPKLDDYVIFNPRLELEVNKTGSFSFEIYPSHPKYNAIKKLTSIIEVYQRGTLIFRGRVLNDNTRFDNRKSVYVEGELAYLNDSIQRPYEYSGSVVGYLDMLINQHNSQVEADKKFTVGNVTVTDPNDYIVRADSQYLNTWQIIEAKLIKLLGGYIVFRRSGGVNYIDYLEDSTYRSDQVIKLGDNMLDLVSSQYGDEIVTALIPTGATIQVEENEELGEEAYEFVVDITSVNDGKDYIFHEEAVGRFGWVFKHVSYENITEPSNLITRARNALNQMVFFTETIEIRAIDKNMVDVDFHRFRFFEYVKVESPVHAVDDFYLIKKQTINLTNARENTIVIGASNLGITDNQLDIRDELNVLRDNNITLENKVTENYKRLSNTVVETSERYAREIREEVGKEIGQVRSDVSTQFEQTKDQFNFEFKTIQEIVDILDGEQKTQFEQIKKYIRFIDGNIVLGEAGNELVLKIQNDRISFIQDNNEVAYLNNNKLYVTDGEFLHSLRLGKFAFFPTETGNLTFQKVVD